MVAARLEPADGVVDGQAGGGHGQLAQAAADGQRPLRLGLLAGMDGHGERRRSGLWRHRDFRMLWAGDAGGGRRRAVGSLLTVPWVLVAPVAGLRRMPVRPAQPEPR